MDMKDFLLKKVAYYKQQVEDCARKADDLQEDLCLLRERCEESQKAAEEFAKLAAQYD